MASGPIKFGGSESPAVEELSGGRPPQINVVTDATGAVRVRPGISAWSGFPAAIPNASPVIAMGAWNGNLIYVTADRKIWAVSAGAVTALSDGTSATQLDGGLRPVIVSTRTRVIISGGGLPQKWEGVGLSARLGGSPPSFSHVTTIAQRVVGNDSGISGLIYWSNVGDTGAETWLTGLNFSEAATKQDPVIGLYENSNELVCLGTETIQMLSPDPSEVFTNARTIEVGWGPPHSYIGLDEKFMGLDARRRVIVSTGRAFEPYSTPMIGRQLDEMITVADCWGMRYKFHNYDLGILNFPTDGRSFALDTISQQWAEWKSQDTVHGGLGAFNATSSYFLADQGIALVGLSTGQIAKLDPAVATDLGAPITSVLTSSFEGHQSSRQKKCDAVRLMFRRGIQPLNSTSVIEMSYRDDLGEYGEPFRIYVGDLNDVDPVVAFRSLGVYRTRQWRITSDSVALSFAGLEEDFTVLDT
jgi:hypothetical protein